MKDFVTYEVAKKLKEKGFKEECLSYYTTEYTLYNNVITLTDDKYLCVSDIDYEEFLVSHNSIKYTNGNYVDAPTIEQVLEWLIDEKGLYVGVSLCKKGWFSIVYDTNFPDDKDYAESCQIDGLSETYKEAAIVGIEYVLDNLI